MVAHLSYMSLYVSTRDYVRVIVVEILNFSYVQV